MTPYKIKTFFAERNPIEALDIGHIGATDRLFNQWIEKNQEISRNSKQIYFNIISFQKEITEFGETLTVLYNTNIITEKGKIDESTFSGRIVKKQC